MKRLGLLVVFALVYLPALGSSSSGTHPDESYYLGISAEMDANGAWLTPTIDGEPKWFKPPLLYWAERAGYAVFGRGFFAGRLPAALSAVALALLTGALAGRMRRCRPPEARASPSSDGEPMLAALLVATSFGWLKFGRIAMMDAPMALALTAAAYGAWRASEEDRPAQLLWAGVGAGAAFMLKGPVGPVLVLLIAGGFLALRRPALLASRWTAAAFGLGAALGLPWYAASLAVHGRRFYEFFVVQQNVDRFRHAWTLEGEATLIVGLLAFLLPWTPLVLASVPAPKRWREPEALLPLVWIGAVLLVFTVPSLKWPHYGLACSPAAAILAARAAPPRWARALTSAVLAALALGGLLALRWPLPAAAAAALVGTAVALLLGAGLIARGRPAASAAAVAAGAALVLGVAVPAVNPPVIPASALARLDGRALHVIGYVPGIFTLGAGRPVRRVEGAEVERALEGGGVVILTAPELARMPPELQARVTPVARWEHVRSYLAARDVARSWRLRDLSPMLEPMLAVELVRARPSP